MFTVPQPPASVSLTATTTSITVTWTAPSSGDVTHYIIDYSPLESGVTSPVTQTKDQAKSVTFNGLTPGTSYTVIVTSKSEHAGITKQSTGLSKSDKTGRLFSRISMFYCLYNHCF